MFYVLGAFSNWNSILVPVAHCFSSVQAIVFDLMNTCTSLSANICQVRKKKNNLAASASPNSHCPSMSV